jgi:hypothetical protein
VDDAHGLGMLGHLQTPPSARPGRRQRPICGLAAGNLVVVGSISDAFGVPLAFAAGPAGSSRCCRAGQQLVHSNPPALPVLARRRYYCSTGAGRAPAEFWRTSACSGAAWAAGLQPAAGAPVRPALRCPEAAWRRPGAAPYRFWASCSGAVATRPAAAFVLSALHARQIGRWRRPWD